MKPLKITLYIVLAIALFLTHTPLLYTVSPEWNDTVETFRFWNILDPKYRELLIIAMLKSFCFSVGTISIIEMLKESAREQWFKIVSIWTFALLDGSGWLLYTLWRESMNEITKNKVSAVYYFIIFATLIGYVGFLSVDNTKQKRTSKDQDKRNNETKLGPIETKNEPIETKVIELMNQKKSYRTIAAELNISYSKVGRIIRAHNNH